MAASFLQDDKAAWKARLCQPRGEDRLVAELGACLEGAETRSGMGRPLVRLALFTAANGCTTAWRQRPEQCHFPWILPCRTTLRGVTRAVPRRVKLLSASRAWPGPGRPCPWFAPSLFLQTCPRWATPAVTHMPRLC